MHTEKGAAARLNSPTLQEIKFFPTPPFSLFILIFFFRKNSKGGVGGHGRGMAAGQQPSLARGGARGLRGPPAAGLGVRR